jgi:hypothetical protein
MKYRLNANTAILLKTDHADGNITYKGGRVKEDS